MGNCSGKKTSAISPRGRRSGQDISAVLSQNTPRSRSGIVYNDMESMLRHGEEIVQPLTGAQKPVVSTGGVAFDVDVSKVRPRRLPPLNAEARPLADDRPSKKGTKKKSSVKAQNTGTVEGREDDDMPVRRKVIKHLDTPRPPRPQDFGFEYSNEEDQLMKEIMRDHALKEKQEKCRRLAEGRRASTNEVASSVSVPEAATVITLMQYTAEEDELMHEIMRDLINQRREKCRRMSERRNAPSRLEARPRAATSTLIPVKPYETEEEAIIEEIMCNDVPTERPKPQKPQTEDDLFIEEILNDDFLEEASKAFKAEQDATITDILNDDVAQSSAHKFQGKGDGRPRTQGLSTRAASRAGPSLK